MRKQTKGIQLLGAAILGLAIALISSTGLRNIDNVLGSPGFAAQPAVHLIKVEDIQLERIKQQSQQDGLTLEEQVQAGRELYQQGQFAAAIARWEPIVQTHAAQGNTLAQASTLSNLALAYQQLGQQEKAQTSLERSWALLSPDRSPGPSNSDQWQVRGQVLMAQGSLYNERGQAEQALETWQQAKEAYDQSHDKNGQIRAQINQAQALRELGFYRQAQDTLNSVVDQVASEPPSLLQATLFRRLGNALKLTGNTTAAQTLLNKSLTIATEYNSPAERSATLLSLGNIARELGDTLSAEDYYQQASAALPKPSAIQLIPVQLAQLALWVETENAHAIAGLWPVIQSQFADLPMSRSAIYHQVNWANSLITFNQILKKRTLASVESGSPETSPATKQAASPEARPDSMDAATPVPWIAIAQQLQRTTQQAQSLEDTRAQSHAMGTLGNVYEQTQQWAIAQEQTQQALTLSQGKADIAYQWQWQLGRLWQAPSNPQQSIAKSLEYYHQAVEALTELRGDLAASTGSNQFSFKENVEPVYRQLVSLLLQTNPQSPEYQTNLMSAQDVIESLRLAELDNYFKEACIDIQPVDISQIDQKAAIVYSIVLDDRLSVILRLPNQPLQQFSTAVSASDVTSITNQLRQQLVTRSRRDYYSSAQQVYNWLIAPAREAIDRSNVDTIVFVLDGALQNVPMAALYDGEHFLIEDYSVALTPGLKLLNPQPWDTDSLSALVAGLTESRQGLSPLPNVAQEIEKIKKTISRNTILLNQEFTRKTLPEKLLKDPYPIVHIATHGQFGSSPEETYLVAWDTFIKVREISQILQANLGDREAIELLILSACETATGDQRAALGLSGVAVKAGARSTLGTLWAINDEATSQFVGYFYEQLTQPGATRASALRAAQIQLLTDPQYKHPIYWAPYILLGSWL
ncbi:MAG: CHAT domain-containing protein [Cyanobacteria bacterium J06635_11]